MMESSLERQFKIHFNSNVNKFKSIAYGYSREITIISNEGFNTIYSKKTTIYQYPKLNHIDI